MTNLINILLIEDNPGDAKLVEIYLRESPSIQFELTHKTRLSDGVAAWQAGKKFDIVLLDLSLPDSTGFDTLTKAMKGFPPSTSIVVLTGLDDEIMGVRAVELGAQDYLVKGQIDTSSLTRSVLHAIQRSLMQQKVENTARHLRQSEERLLRAQRIAQIGNYEIPLKGGSTPYSSEEVFRIFGIDAEQNKLTFDTYIALIHPNDRAFVQEKLNQAIATRKQFVVEHRIKLNDDTIKYLRNQGEIEQDETTGNTLLVGTLQDITTYKQAEQMFEDAQARYQTIFKESQDAIYVATIDGKFADFNNALPKMLGYTNEEFKALQLTDMYVSVEAYKDFETFMQSDNKVRDLGVKLRRKGGEVIDVLVTSTLWKHIDGTVKGYHGIIRDITALRKAEELIRAKEVAERSSRLKQKFLASMSHEIRTPMNVVVGMTHLIENTQLDQQQREYLNALKLSSDNLLRLINNILDFSRIESGKLSLEQRPFRLMDLVNNLIQTYKFKAEEKGIDLFTVSDAKLPDIVVGDSVRLYQVLNNLVSNAIKFTDDGEIMVRSKVIGGDDSMIHVQFSVKDTGIGISEEKQRNIFEVFTQADQNTTRLYGGTGLGLSIAKEVVKLFGGDINVKSRLGRGSTFIFDVRFRKNKEVSINKNKQPRVMAMGKSPATPMIDDSKTLKDIADSGVNDNVKVYTGEELTEQELAAASAADVQVKPANILLVEDNKLNQIVATDLLNKWSKGNIKLEIADNGKIAIDKLEQKAYDVILMDISMPIMDGYQTTIHIRNKMESPIKDIPIIAMTAHAFNKNAEKCFEVGMNEFVSKPINPKVLFAKLKGVLDKLTTTVAEDQAANQAISTDITKEVSIDLSYLDSLTGGDPDIKLMMLETLVSDLPSEIDKIEEDYAAKDWDQLKASAHKMKSTSAYMGLPDMQEAAKVIENNAWERKDLHLLGGLVEKLAKGCRIAHKELIAEVESLKVLQEA
ncbi:MAG: response regulator [Chitinophagales bacterium]